MLNIAFLNDTVGWNGDHGWHHPSFSNKQIVFVVLSSEQHVNLPSARATSPSHMIARQRIIQSSWALIMATP